MCSNYVQNLSEIEQSMAELLTIYHIFTVQFLIGHRSLLTGLLTGCGCTWSWRFQWNFALLQRNRAAI